MLSKVDATQIENKNLPQFWVGSPLTIIWVMLSTYIYDIFVLLNLERKK